MEILWRLDAYKRNNHGLKNPIGVGILNVSFPFFTNTISRDLNRNHEGLHYHLFANCQSFFYNH